MERLNNTEHHAQLLALTHVSSQISPLLDVLHETNSVILPETVAETSDPSDTIEQLHQYWQTHYPEAGRAYWQTRTWTMLTWQPITLALVATYYAKRVPPLSQLRQGVQLSSGLVANFDFLDSKWQAGDQHQRQVIAANELKRLIEQLANQVESIFRLSPATREKLLADTLMEMLLRGLKHMVASKLLPAEQMRPTFAHELQHWQQALNLPITRFGRLEVDNQGEHYIQRRSCCIHYKRADGGYCQGCPNAPLSK
ncbi:siderophore ferric iron reductase [Vibrio sp. DNB22_10_4]